MRNGNANDDRPREPIEERLQADAASTRPAFDAALHDRLVDALAEARMESEKPSTSSLVTPERTPHMERWAVYGVVASLAAVLILAAIVIQQGRNDAGPNDSMIAGGNVPPESDGASNEDEAVVALCVVLADTTDTPAEMRRRMKDIAPISTGETFSLGNVRSTTDSLFDQVPWALLENSGRRSQSDSSTDASS